MSLFGKLIEWSQRNDGIAAGHTTGLAAAVLLLASEAHQVTRQALSSNHSALQRHTVSMSDGIVGALWPLHDQPFQHVMQVKLTPEAVAAVFDAKRSTVKKHIAEVRSALVAAAQLLPWLQDITRSNVTSHLRIIIQVANAMPQAHAEPASSQAATADQSIPPSSSGQSPMPGGASTAELPATVVAEDDQQTWATSRISLSKKRQRSDQQAEAAQTACNSEAGVGLRLSKGSAFVVPDLDSEQFAAETVIKEHEWPQYVHMPKRLRCSNGNHTKKPLHTHIPAC